MVWKGDVIGGLVIRKLVIGFVSITNFLITNPPIIYLNKAKIASFKYAKINAKILIDIIATG